MLASSLLLLLIDYISFSQGLLTSIKRNLRESLALWHYLVSSVVSRNCSMMMPTGFRFNPTDEEMIEILERKASGQEMPLHAQFIVQRNVYDHDPQHLQWDDTTLVASNESYCYCIKENDSREVSGQGWWKATGHVKKIYAYNSEDVVGYKRPLTFHRFKNSEKKRKEAIKTNWIMHEFSLHNNTTDWRLCRIKHKGKPSAQEELENFRNQIIRNCDPSSSSSISTQPDFAGVYQAVDHNYNNFMQGMDHEHTSQGMGTDNYINGDYQQPESSCLWSWQN
uniref:NAC transcription factor 89 n=1 Tax=Litchi chinensis TaxID=151069 RepID=A0A8K1HZN5_LITCN|nr:NAC transcription factor 89 [Litchi chinensis]